MSKVYIGIDPGTTGAIARLCCDTCTVVQHPNSKEEMLSLFTGLAGGCCAIAIEDVIGVCGGAPIAKRSAYQLGNVVGFWEALAITAGVPFVLVPPQKWQKSVWGHQKFPDKASRKTYSRDEAVRVYPALRDNMRRKKDHDKADAVHIARYAMRWDLAGRI